MRRLLIMMAGFLLVILLPQFLHAQNKTISGKITDANGNALPGVSVLINKTNQGTVTDATGQFTLTAPANSTVSVSYTGYKSQTLKADDTNAAVNIKLEDDVAKLDEVVVTGFNNRH